MSKLQVTILVVGAAVIAGLAFFLFATPANAPGENNESSENGEKNAMGSKTVVFQTTKGEIVIELFTEQMPITTANFLKLANEGFYDGTKFHRVIPDFMIQGGDPLTKDDSQMARWGTGDPGYKIQDEFPPDVHSNTRGTISMANAGPNTGGSQFFINVADNTFLDGKHPVFGRVVNGIEVADAIVSTPRNADDRPDEPMMINKVVVQ